GAGVPPAGSRGTRVARDGGRALRRSGNGRGAAGERGRPPPGVPRRRGARAARVARHARAARHRLRRGGDRPSHGASVARIPAEAGASRLMGFLSPLLLVLGAAVAVPIILHLFQRHQGPRVIFPALRYLRRAEKEHARQIKLRQLLLMLLRVAAILLLALAAARPFARGAGAQHSPTAVAIVLDNSLSTGVIAGDRRLLDVLRDRALETLEAAGPDDRFWLIRAGAPWEPALSGDPLVTAERVRQTAPTAGA